MNALKNAIKDIKLAIPKEVLDLVFTNRDRHWGSMALPESSDFMMERDVLRNRVLVDCNLIGGTEVTISLEGVPVVRTNDYISVYRIPKDRTQGRTITSALNITFSNNAAISTVNPYVDASSSGMLNVGQQLLDSAGTIPITSTAQVQLIGENVVMVQDTTLLPANVYLRCILANDENLNNLQIRSYRPFSKLCVLAVKSYIYNNYIVRLDIGELWGGQQIGKIKEIIDTYADCEELYQDFLKDTMQRVFFMNDNTSYTRYIRLVGGGAR